MKRQLLTVLMSMLWSSNAVAFEQDLSSRFELGFSGFVTVNDQRILEFDETLVSLAARYYLTSGIYIEPEFGLYWEAISPVSPPIVPMFVSDVTLNPGDVVSYGVPFQNRSGFMALFNIGIRQQLTGRLHLEPRVGIGYSTLSWTRFNDDDFLPPGYEPEVEQESLMFRIGLQLVLYLDRGWFLSGGPAFYIWDVVDEPEQRLDRLRYSIGLGYTFGG